MAHCVRLIEYAPEITLIFCLRHRCTKNQSLQVFGRIEQEFNGSTILSLSSKGQNPLKIAHPNSIFPALISALSDFSALLASLTRESPHEEIEGKIELRKIPYVKRNWRAS